MLGAHGRGVPAGGGGMGHRFQPNTGSQMTPYDFEMDPDRKSPLGRFFAPAGEAAPRDRLIGTLSSRLRSSGIYDRSVSGRMRPIHPSGACRSAKSLGGRSAPAAKERPPANLGRGQCHASPEGTRTIARSAVVGVALSCRGGTRGGGASEQAQGAGGFGGSGATATAAATTNNAPTIERLTDLEREVSRRDDMALGLHGVCPPREREQRERARPRSGRAGATECEPDRAGCQP